MAKKCVGTFRSAEQIIGELSNARVLKGLRSHSDPTWWKSAEILRENQAYLHRWGSVLRREARRRRLL